MASLVMSRTVSGSMRFFPPSDACTTSSGNGSTALPATFLCDASTPATITCLLVNSHAQSGRGDLKTWRMGLRRLLLNERHLIDLAQCRFAGQDFGNGALAQR